MIQSFFGRNRYKTADPKRLTSPAMTELDMLAEEALRTARDIQDTVAKLRAQDQTDTDTDTERRRDL